jgi:branched-chain amino acid transport system substrate-binding protein
MDRRTAGSTGIRRPTTRRSVIKGLGAAAGAAAGALLPAPMRYIQAGAAEPIKIGFQCHRTGIGAAYGRWYERTTDAAVKLINDGGGMAGRPIELIVEDDGTDPKRGAEVVEKFATEHKVDVVFGTLFSHVVIGSAPAAAENKMPYFVVSEGHHVASGTLNRYVFQPGITDVRSQVISLAPWITQTLGKKITMIFPDFAFGHDHRDYFSAALAKQGGSISALIPIPPTETSFTRYFAQVPAGTEVIYHVMVGPGVLSFVKEMGEHFGSTRPQVFGFIDSLEAVNIASPGLEFLDGTFFWEAFPRYAEKDQTPYDKFYRAAVKVDDNGAALEDPKDVSTYSHMFGCWETLYVIKAAIEKSGYRSATAKDKRGLIEAVEAMTDFAEGNEHPQGEKKFIGQIHQAFGHQNISKVLGGKLQVVHRTEIADGLYEPEADYTKQPL